MSRTATSGRAPRETTLRPRADHCGVERDRAARCPWPTGLSAPLSAAAAPLIGGGELPFLALGLFSLAVLAPAPDRLGAASHGDERNNLLDHLHAPTRGLEPHQTARCSSGAETEMPKPADLAVLGLRPHDYFTGTRSLSTLNGSGRAKWSLGPSGRAPGRGLCRSSNNARQPRAGRARYARSSLYRLARARVSRELHRRQPCHRKARLADGKKQCVKKHR
jgi:hypothetical protein